MPTQSENPIPLARATLARFVAESFSQPEKERIARFTSAGVQDELRQAASVLEIDHRLVNGVFNSFKAGPPEEDVYNRILGHTVRSECPPYELEYRTSEVFQQAQTLADISGFYRAFGYEAAGPLVERADHIVAEWEFLSVLAHKQTLAINENDAVCCLNAQRGFLSEHAAMWMPAFFERIRRMDVASFLGCVSNLGESVLRSWCTELNVSIGQSWLELRPISDEDSSISCGAPGTVELGPLLASAMEGR